ncbi:helix-turn-helix transcriptional regulator [Pannonibacter sp.]|uniref:helix-turn-helix transcriptional regulator n=1 Tax=Pannonibacter sp. TaxID=1906786 RepID=UPI003F6E7F43
MRLFRLFSLMDHFRSRLRPTTARELGQLLGVSVRTVYRDIADLQAMGAPIRGEGGIGYVMERGYFKPSLRFDTDELEAIALGMRLVAERGGAHLAEAAGRVSAKIASSIGEDARETMISTPLEAGPSSLVSSPEERNRHDRLRVAIRDRQRLRIDYVSRSGQPSSRLARPLGLTAFDESWLLTIWCERAEDFRHLRVDLIRSAEPTGETFRHEAGKRFADVLQRERGVP